MKTRYFSLTVIVLFLIIAVIAVGASGSASTDNASRYGTLIDEIIKKCETKVDLSDSTCEAVRKDASLACMKAAYYRIFREEFIRQMIEQGVEARPHKVKLFLNRRFLEAVRAARGNEL